MKNKIKEFRIAKGISQEQMAEDLGISMRTLQRYEKGSIADFSTCLKIAEYLCVGVDELIISTVHGTE